MRFCSLMLIFGTAGTAWSASPSIIQLKDHQRQYQGRLLSMDHRHCWLQERDGQLHELRIKELKHFKRTTTTFTPFTLFDTRAALKKEFGPELEIKTSGSYVVMARKGAAKDYARVLDNVYSSFRREFRTRGFDVKTPEFPLVAIVFPSQQQFHGYARRDGVHLQAGTVGYYQRKTNRVALYDGKTPGPPRLSVLPENKPDANAFFRVAGDLRDTLIHEATHQIAFNTGIHNRRGHTPRWVIEGLATLFEAEGIRHHVSRDRKSLRWNRERLGRFKAYSASRREPGSLRRFITNDEDVFTNSALDAYAEAWALTYFLFETRGIEYARYLKRTANRDPLKPYTAQQRLIDFHAEFGRPEGLETAYLRFINRLK